MQPAAELRDAHVVGKSACGGQREDVIEQSRTELGVKSGGSPPIAISIRSAYALRFRRSLNSKRGSARHDRASRHVAGHRFAILSRDRVIDPIRALEHVGARDATRNLRSSPHVLRGSQGILAVRWDRRRGREREAPP